MCQGYGIMLDTNLVLFETHGQWIYCKCTEVQRLIPKVMSKLEKIF